MQFPKTQHGPYTLIGTLASGGMGEVYLARPPQASQGVSEEVRPVVLKCMYLRHQQIPVLVTRFYDEARIGMRLRHPNLVRVHDVRDIDNRHTIVMEYVPGPSLRELLDAQGSRVPSPVALEVLRQLAKALRYVHQLKDEHGEPFSIVHRDIGPDNILVEHDGTVRLIDFGVAAHAPERRDDGLIGTVTYMSPEQCAEAPVDARSDLYSVGTVFWEMLRGKSPYPRFNHPRAMLMITEESVAPPLCESADENARLYNKIWAGLHARDPDERFQSADALLKAIDIARRTVSGSNKSALAHWVDNCVTKVSADA